MRGSVTASRTREMLRATPMSIGPSPSPTSTPAKRPFRRWPALLVSLTIVALAIHPALREQPYDSYPLSTYPMFSVIRKTSWIHVVVGFDAEGQEYKIPPHFIANFEVMQAVQTIRREIRAKRASALCEEVAARVATKGRFAPVVRLEVQSRKFDPARYFVDEDGQVPIKLKRRARCEVPR